MLAYDPSYIVYMRTIYYFFWRWSRMGYLRYLAFYMVSRYPCFSVVVLAVSYLRWSLGLNVVFLITATVSHKAAHCGKIVRLVC